MWKHSGCWLICPWLIKRQVSLHTFAQSLMGKLSSLLCELNVIVFVWLLLRMNLCKLNCWTARPARFPCSDSMLKNLDLLWDIFFATSHLPGVMFLTLKEAKKINNHPVSLFSTSEWANWVHTRPFNSCTAEQILPPEQMLCWDFSFLYVAALHCLGLTVLC